MSGLRDARRRQSMTAIQSAALDLFETRGFDAVTVTDVAAAAGVAERTVYRHFGTKEGIILWVDADDVFFADLIALLADHTLMQAARIAATRADTGFAGEQRAHASRVSALISRVPQARAQVADQVRMAAAVVADAWTRARGDEPGALRPQVESAAVVSALSVALEQWERAGARGSLSETLLAALDAVEGLGAD